MADIIRDTINVNVDFIEQFVDCNFNGLIRYIQYHIMRLLKLFHFNAILILET